MTSRADIRRALALAPDAGQLELAAGFAALAGDGPLAPAEAGELLIGYVFDREGGALLATTEDRRRWLAGPLFRAIGPGNAAPLDDVIAALIAGPILAKSDDYVAHRWAPRADDAIALAVAALPEADQPAALARLAGDLGPEPALLAQSVVQCARVLAWSPHLLDAPIAARIVADAIALVTSSRPRPLLEAIAHALGPIAAQAHPLGDRVRAAAHAALDATHRAPPASFAAELAAIGRTRRLPDEDRILALPAREIAQAGAYILGFSAPLERAAFAAHRALVIDRPDGAELVDAFADGLIAAAHVPALAELAGALIDGDTDGPLTALGIAAALPLDPIAARLVAELEDERPSHRALACSAVELLDDPIVDPALALRLGDPSAEVAAAAARVLIERGRADLIGEHAGREVHPIRGAIARAATGDLSVPVIGELVRGVTRELGGEPTDATPIVRLIGDCLLGSIDGLETAANLIGGVPEAAGLIALAASAELDRDVGVLAPPSQRAHLASVVLQISDDDPELAGLGLFLLARVSAGDATIADVIADALARTSAAPPPRSSSGGHAANLVAALAELRVATPKTGAALAALVSPDQPIGARVLAAAACGRALPRDHEAWRDVRDLLGLGTLARSAAWTALRDRARRS